MALGHQNKNFISSEPFDGLFTQGMVCHETYKDSKNNWLSPSEVFSDDGKNFFTVKNKTKNEITIKVENNSITSSLKTILNNFDIEDLFINEPPIDEVIGKVLILSLIHI